MKKAYIICGAPSSGKSTYGRELAAKEKAVLIDIDAATEHLVKLGLCLAGKDPLDRDSTFFKDTFREPIYEQLFDLARDNLAFHNVVLIGPFTREIQDPNWLETLRARLKANVEVHFVHCSTEIRRQRMVKRGNPRDKTKLKKWEEYMAYYQEGLPPCFEHVFIENSIESKRSK